MNGLFPRRSAPARVNYSDYFKESNRLPAAQEKIFVSGLALSREGKKCLGVWRGVKEPLLYRRQKSWGGRVFEGEEGSPGASCPVLLAQL